MRTHPMVAAAALAIAWTAVSSVPAHPVTGAVQVSERCGGRTVTIPGTNASETLTGTAGADVILARGGNDVIRGLGGNDTICPGPGRDAVKGGAGNDTFVADPVLDGNDVFVGDTGLDQVSYTARTAGLSVTIDGAADDGEPGEADDVGLTVETVRGGAGDDRLVGSPNADTLSGAGGDDVLIGGLGDDDLNGGDGDDELRGNAGDDFLDGEADNDTIVAAGSPDGADFVEGGSGIDTASYAFRGQDVRVSIDLIANDGAIGEGDNVQLDIEDIQGGSGNDQLIANFFQQERNRLSGNAGSDFISVTDNRGGDIADGGSFNDLCFTDPGDPRISCES